MKQYEFKKLVDNIVNDTSKSIDERLDEALALSPGNLPDNDDDVDEKDVIIYSSLIDMLQREAYDHSHDLTLLQLYVLLAEAYDELDDYRPMEELANGVIRLMYDNMTPVEVYKETIPRFCSALGKSVYNHALYKVLFMYVRSVLRENPNDKSIKPLAKKLLKLNILLKANPWRAEEWNKEFETAISQLFTKEELTQIMINPKIGHLKKDPVEYTRKWEEIYYDLEDELNERFESVPRHMGMCFRIWSVKREILKDKYGIDWHSPSQMNPRVRFD